MNPTQASTPPVGSKQRSPNYPSITLADALVKVRKVYDSEHTHPASREVVARGLGYNTLNGASLPVIGSLKRYGLLEDAGDGLRVTPDAVAILELPENDPERRAALQRTAFAPSFFDELRNEFGDKLPSDANLRHYLIKKKFLPKAADEAIRVYRANLGLVGVGETAYNDDMTVETVSEPTTVGAIFAQEKRRGATDAGAFTKLAEKFGAPLLSQTLVVSIPRNFRVDVAVLGDEIKRDDLAKIKSQFNRWIEGLEEAFEN